MKNCLALGLALVAITAGGLLVLILGAIGAW